MRTYLYILASLFVFAAVAGMARPDTAPDSLPPAAKDEANWAVNT